MTLRRILWILVIAGLCYLGWQRLRPMVIEFVCDNERNKARTTASQRRATAGKVDAILSKADEAYQSCLDEWGLEEDDSADE